MGRRFPLSASAKLETPRPTTGIYHQDIISEPIHPGIFHHFKAERCLAATTAGQ